MGGSFICRTTGYPFIIIIFLNYCRVVIVIICRFFRDRIVKKGKTYGTFTVELPGGKSNVYSFAHLNTLNMYYVVVADYDKLINYIKEQNN